MKNKIYFYIGLFLLADAIASLYWGVSCLDSCFNNSPIGEFVRIVRAGIGAYLVARNK